MPSRYYYLLEPLIPAWVLGFTLLARRPTWTWRQGVGLALILYPFVDMAFGIYYSIPTLATSPTLQPVPEASWWRTVNSKLLFDFLVPIGGLLLFFSRPGEPSFHNRILPEVAPRMLRAAGVWRARGLGSDVLLGCALFVPLAVAYGGAYTVAALLSRGAGVSNEASLFLHLTPALVLALSLVAGITEEFLFRGLLLRFLGERMPVVAAALLQAALFGFVHAGYGNWAHVIGPAIFGLALAYVTLRLGIGAAILLHVAVDVVAFGAEVLKRDPANPWVTGMLLALVGANVLAFVLYRAEPIRRLLPWTRERARLPGEAEENVGAVVAPRM